jgi:hypothetical protein
MFVDPTTGSDWNSGLSPDQSLKTIAEAMNKIAEDRTGVVMVLKGQPPIEKKQLEDWPPEVDNLNEEWWK